MVSSDTVTALAKRKGKWRTLPCKFFNHPRGCDRGDVCECSVRLRIRTWSTVVLIISCFCACAGPFIHDFNGSGRDVRDRR